MKTQIKFGTSGWRAVMAEEFTFANVRRAVGGIARYVAAQKPQGARVIVGRDPRFLGETFCSMAAEILASARNYARDGRGSRAHSGICLCCRPDQGRRRDQFYGIAQSAGVQRDQVLHPGWMPGAAGSYEED